MSDAAETLKAVLLAMGIDDAPSMSDHDAANLARTMGLEVPEELSGTGVHEEESGVSASQAMDTSEEEHEALNTAFVSDETAFPPASSEHTSQAAPSTAEGADSTHDDTISAFCSITGGDPTAARHLLEAFGWDLDGAVSMFLEGNASHMFGDAPSTPPSGPGARAPVHTRFDTTENAESAALPNIRHRMMGIGNPANEVSMPPIPGSAFSHEQHLNSVLHNLMQSTMGMHTEDDDEDGPSAAAMGSMSMPEFMAAYERASAPPQRRGGDRYDEDGIRLPDPVQRERLVGASSFRYGRGQEEFGRAEDPSVEWMFPPPRHLSSQATLDEARAEAQREGRWLLVNIQTHEEFSSHMLNRDTWVHDTIESILRTTYLFWQRGHTSGDGAAYMRMHRLTNDDLPHIGIIDPRTGAKLLTLTGFLPPEDLAIRLIEFQERHPLPLPSARASDAPSSRADSVAGSETRSDPSSRSSSIGNLADTDSSPAMSGAGTVSGRSLAGGIAALEADSGKGEAAGPAAIKGPTEQKQKERRDYGEVPAEPAEGEEGAVKVSIKLSNGKAFARRYLKSDKVDRLFAVAAAMDAAGAAQDFDLVSRFPTLSLLASKGQTIGECSLAGSQLIMKLL